MLDMPGARMGGCLTIHAIGIRFRCGSHAQSSPDLGQQRIAIAALADLGQQRIVIAAHPQSPPTAPFRGRRPVWARTRSTVHATLGLAGRQLLR